MPLRPLYALLTETVMAVGKVFCDDTPLPVLDRTRRRTRIARLWCYAVDDRPWQGPVPPVVVYRYAEDRRGRHVKEHLDGFRGVLQVDGYSGYDDLARPDRPGGAITLAYCLAHARREFFNVHKRTKDPVAAEALRRIGEIYAIEARIRSRPADERVAVRQAETKPLMAALWSWLMQRLEEISAKSSLSSAIRYTLGHWEGLTVFLVDGRVEVDNNTVERGIRPIATMRSLYPSFSGGWKHWKFSLTISSTRAASALEGDRYPFVSEVGRLDLIWGAGDDLLGREETLVDQATDGVIGDAQCRRGLAHGHPFAVLLCGAVGVDAMDPAEGTDPLCGPRFVLTGTHSHAVQRCGNVVIVPAPGHAPHYRQCLVRGPTAVLASSGFLDPQLRVLAAPPVDHQDDLACCIVDIGDNVFDQGGHEPVARAHARARRVPGRGEIRGKAGEVRRGGGRLRRPPGIKLRLAGFNAAQRCLPTLLQLRGDQTIVRVAGSVAPLC
jgi:hypothetical protein